MTFPCRYYGDAVGGGTPGLAGVRAFGHSVESNAAEPLAFPCCG